MSSSNLKRTVGGTWSFTLGLIFSFFLSLLIYLDGTMHIIERTI